MTASQGRVPSRWHPRTGVLFALLGLGVGGCGRGETIELVPIRGCGLDQAFSGLRVRVLGDFPASGGLELLLGPEQHGSIPALPERATGIAAEGLFGTTTTAIGRSWGVDPQLVEGRLEGIDDQVSVLPVFFAAPDSLCELDAQVPARADAVAVASRSGDVVLVGGLDPAGGLLDELVHVDLLTGAARVLNSTLPGPRRGHSVHAIDENEGRRFMILGGAGPGAPADQRLVVDVDGSGSVGEAGPLTVEGEPLRLSEHAAARSPLDARILLAGGCDGVDQQARCEPSTALAGSYWFDPAKPAATERLPALTQPRHGAHAQVTADGVAWIAGGWGSDGVRLGSVERLRPGGEWTIVHELASGGALGLAVLDDGLVLLSDEAGAIHWWSEAGSGSLDPTSRAPPLAAVSSTRPMLALPGERVFVDTWLFTPGTAAVDPTAGRVELSSSLARHGAQMLALHDGSILVVGGQDTATQALAEPPLLRLRPRLDGPDEWTPELAGPQTDAFVTNAPGRATVIVGGLRLDADGGPADALPPVRAHVRGFRSRALRLEFSFEAQAGTTAHVLLGQGSETLVAIALREDQIVVRQRDPDGSTQTLACGPAEGTLDGQLVLELGADGQLLRVDGEGGVLALCELAWPSSAGLAVGFGVSGAADARFFGLRLARR